MYRFETNRADFRSVLKAPLFWICQLRQTLLDRDGMIRNGRFHFTSMFTDLDKTRTEIFSNSLDASARKLCLVCHIEQTILKAG